MSIRTGWDKILPHMTSATFASIAPATGIVTEIDEKNKVVKVKYADQPIAVSRNESTPYSTSQIDAFHIKHQLFGYLIPASQLPDYPLGMIVRLSRNTNGKVVDRLRCVSREMIPAYPALKEQESLIKKLDNGSEDALYFITMDPINLTEEGKTLCYDFGTEYTNNSGSFIQQTRVPNVSVGEKVKEGDVLVYNKGFFVPEFNTKQVTFKHGVIATVALVEKSTNHEDACELSPSFSQKLTTHPSHERSLNLTNDMEVSDFVSIGDYVQSTDPVCTLTNGDVALLGTGEKNSYTELLSSVGRSSPNADEYGYVTDIKIFYSCPKSDLSPSLLAILKDYEKRVKTKQKALAIPAEHAITAPGYVEPGSKYHGVDFTENTVLIEIMITGELDLGPGDKVCFGNSNKSETSLISEKDSFTESGILVDALFSTTSIENRIVESPYDGLAERNMEVLAEQTSTDYLKEIGYLK